MPQWQGPQDHIEQARAAQDGWVVHGQRSRLARRTKRSSRLPGSDPQPEDGPEGHSCSRDPKRPPHVVFVPLAAPVRPGSTALPNQRPSGAGSRRAHPERAEPLEPLSSGRQVPLPGASRPLWWVPLGEGRSVRALLTARPTDPPCPPTPSKGTPFDDPVHPSTRGPRPRAPPPSSSSPRATTRSRPSPSDPVVRSPRTPPRDGASSTTRASAARPRTPAQPHRLRATRGHLRLRAGWNPGPHQRQRGHRPASRGGRLDFVLDTSTLAGRDELTIVRPWTVCQRPPSTSSSQIMDGLSRFRTSATRRPFFTQVLRNAPCRS